jgi:hypothetical protein
MVPLAILAPNIHVKALNLGSTPSSGATEEVRGGRAVGKRVPWTSAKAEGDLRGFESEPGYAQFCRGRGCAGWEEWKTRNQSQKTRMKLVWINI